MTELVFFSLFNAFVLYCFSYGQIFYSVTERLQMHSPAWISRKVLMDCLPCTCFWWLAVPESFLLFYLSHSPWCLLYPFAIATLTTFFYPR
jgi:hypothetical protein